MFYEEKQLRSDLNFFLSISCILIVIGLLFIYSSSSVFALESFGSAHYFVKKQIVGLIIGIAAMIVASRFPLELIQSLSPYLFLVSLFLTALTLTPFGVRIHGSSRWLNIMGFTFQPSELLKISLLSYLAYFFSKKEFRLGSFYHGYLPFLIILGATCAVLLKQPDFGLSVTLTVTAFMLFFILHFQINHVILTISAIVPIIIGLILYKPYRIKRVLTFLDPWSDPQGAGFQIIQSLIAIGTGSWLGTGVSHSKQKFFYLPMQHTDFIFSIIAEETGLIGSGLLIFLYTLLLYFGMRIAWQLKDTYSVLLTLGFIILITLQTIINLCVATGLMPTKGIGLPFISYGNSALIGNLITVGLIINCVRSKR